MVLLVRQVFSPWWGGRYRCNGSKLCLEVDLYVGTLPANTFEGKKILFFIVSCSFAVVVELQCT